MAVISFEHKPFIDSEVGLKLETLRIYTSSISNSNGKELVTENGKVLETNLYHVACTEITLIDILQNLILIKQKTY